MFLLSSQKKVGGKNRKNLFLTRPRGGDTYTDSEQGAQVRGFLKKKKDTKRPPLAACSHPGFAKHQFPDCKFPRSGTGTVSTIRDHWDTHACARFRTLTCSHVISRLCMGAEMGALVGPGDGRSRAASGSAFMASPDSNSLHQTSNARHQRESTRHCPQNELVPSRRVPHHLHAWRCLGRAI